MPRAIGAFLWAVEMATRSLGQLTIDLIAKTGGFEAGMDRAARAADRKSREIEQGARQAAQQVQQVWGIAASAIGGALSGISVGLVFSKFITETVNAQNEQAQLAAVLRSTGQAAGFSIRQLNDMADAMEKATAFSAGDINQAQTTLLAFTGIAGEQFPKALQAAADMASRTGMTVKSAAETIGRALDIPSEGLSSLSRQGFRFTDDQKRLAEQLEATGRTAEAQAIILKALEESYGGAAVAARDTLGGSFQALQNTISSLLTGSDDGVQGLRNAVEGLNEALRSDAAEKTLNAIAVTAEIVAGVLVTRLVAGIAASGVAFAASTIQAARYQATLAGMAGVSATAAAGIGAVSVAARVASAAMSLIGGPIGAVVLAVGGAAYAWREYSSSARDAASKSVKDVSDIKGSVDGLVESYQRLNTLQREQVINIKTEDLSAALKETRAAVEDLGNAFSPALTKGTRSAAQFRSDFTAEIAAVATDSNQSSEQMAAALSKVIDSYIQSGRATEDNRAKLTELAQKVVEASGNVSRLTAELNALKNAQDEVSGGVPAVADSLERYRKNYEKFMQDYATPQERLKSAIAEQKTLLGELYSPEVEKRLRDRILPKSSRGGSETTELQNLIKQLDLQRATLGMTEAAAGRYRIEIAKGSEADRARALSIYDQVQAWKEADRASKQAAESARYIAAINRELEVFQQQQDIEIAGIGMGDRQREEMERELAVRQKYAERFRELEEAQQVDSTKLSEEQYQRRLAALADAQAREIAIVQKGAAEKLAAESNWINGVTKGLQNYANEANNVAASVNSAITSAFQGMEDSLVEFVKTGKLSFSDLADSIISDLIRIAIRQSITGPLASLFGGWFGGSSGASVTMPTGGIRWNALGGVYDTPSLSQYSNQVHTSPKLFAFANGAGVFAEAGPEAIMPLSRGPDGKLGVKADISSVQGGNQVNITVNVSDSGSSVTTQGDPSEFGKRLADSIRRTVQEELALSYRQGGVSWNARQGGF